VALIELDLYAPAEPPAEQAPQARHRYTPVAAVLVLVLTLAGSALPRSVLWRRIGLAPISAPDGAFQLAGGRLYTFDWSGSRLVTTAWSPEPLRRLWSRTGTTAPDDDGGATPSFGWSVDPAGPDDVVLQSYLGSTVVDARTGQARWTSATPLTSMAGGRVGLVYDQEFRPGTEYDEATGAAGPLYPSASGVFHTEPPVRTTLRALDMRNGRELWRTGFAGLVIAADGKSDPGAIVVVAADRISLLAAATGAVLRERRLTGPAPGEVAFGDSNGGMLLLRHGTGEGGTVTAYSMATLEPVWHRSEPIAGSPSFCGGMLCDDNGNGVVVLDPATGQPRWRTGAGALFGRGQAIVEVDSRENRPVALHDPVTGAMRVALDGWTWFAYGRDDSPLVLGRLDGTRTLFGVLIPARRAVQPLGYAPTPLTSCESDDRYVACRITGGVEVWAYLS
jgi:outer membrane protein assembly factor BamB